MPPVRDPDGDRLLPTREELLAATIAELEQRMRQVLPDEPDMSFRALVRRMAEVKLRYAGSMEPLPWRPPNPPERS